MSSTVPQQQTEATKMAAANDATVVTCTNNSDYAVICSFFEQFGDKSGLLCPSFHDLQEMLENVEEVSYPLIELHVKLMRKLKKSVSFDRWERAAAKYAHSYSDQDGWAIERFGYKKLNLDVKLRLLKNLLEAQFDGNIKFKNEINKVTSEELRLQPLGKDIHGRRYWHLLDDDCNLRVYCEDLDEETWELVSSDKESMLKLIQHLSSCKDLQEDGETSPATSEENSVNGQEEDSKVEIEAQVQHLEPIEAKRLKLECAEVPATSDSHPESIVGEAIESPILLVKGEGNGADCDTGNPGEKTNEESRASRSSNSEQAKMENTNAVICDSDGLQSCSDKSESLAIFQSQTELLSSLPSSGCQSNASNLVPNHLIEAPLLKLDNEMNVEANNPMKPTLSENCSENPSALDSPDKEIPGSSSNPTKVAITCLLSDDANSGTELTSMEGSPVNHPPEDVKPISIDQSSVEVDGFDNQQGCLYPLKDNGIAEISNNDDSCSLEVDVSDHPVTKEASVFETTTQPSRNQELPKSDGSSAVTLDSIQIKSPTASKPTDILVDAVPSDHPFRSTCDVVTRTLVTPAGSLPRVTPELEETNQIVEPVLMPDCSSLVQKDLAEVEESHSEQTVKVTDNILDNMDPILIRNTKIPEGENRLLVQSHYESPVQSAVHDEKAITEVDSSTSPDEKIIPKVHATSNFCNMPVVSKDSSIEIETVDVSAACAIHSAEPCLPGSMSVSEKQETITVIDFVKDGDPPSPSCDLQRPSQCSESDPITEDIDKSTFKEETNSLSTTNEIEVTEDVQVVDSSLNDLPVPPTSKSTSAVPTTVVMSLPVPVVKKDSETRTCSDSVNQCILGKLVVSVATPEPATENLYKLSISKTLIKEVVPLNPKEEEMLAKTNTPDLAEEKKILSIVEDKLHVFDEELAISCIENVASNEKTVDKKELADKKEVAGKEVADKEVADKEVADEKEFTDEKELADEKELVDEKELADEKKLADEKELADEEEIAGKEKLTETGSLETKEQAVAYLPILAKNDCLVLDLPAGNESTSYPNTVDEEILVDESKATAEISRTSVEKSLLLDGKADDACSIPVLLQNNVLNEMQSEEILEPEQKGEISPAFAKDEIPLIEHEAKSNVITQNVESKQTDEPKAEEISPASPLAKLPPTPEAVDEPNRSLRDPVKEESIVMETTEVIKEQTERKEGIQTRAGEDESISSRLPVEVPCHTTSEIIQKSELIAGSDDSCNVSVEPVPAEVKNEIPTIVVTHELVSVHQEPESNPVPEISSSGKLKQADPNEVSAYKRPDNEEIDPVTAEKVPLQMKNEVLSAATCEVTTEKEPSIEASKASAQESVPLEKKDSISSFAVDEEHLVSKGRLSTEFDTDDHTVISSQSEIPELLVKEESPPVVPDKIVVCAIPDSCTPVENDGQDQALADKLKTISRPVSPKGKENTRQAHASLIPEKEEKEASPIPEVVLSRASDTLPEAPVPPGSPLNMEGNTTNAPSAEKSSNLNQLTFDFDASAPMTIILPPSKKPGTSAKRRGRKRSRIGYDGNADSGKENDGQPTVLRQSSRIAKLREKEDEDRRKEEADRLQRLKEEHERREKRRTARDEKMKKMEEKQQRRQLKSTIKEDVTYRQSEEESSSSDEEKNSEEEGRKKKCEKDKRRHKKKKIEERPWDSTDSSEKSSESDVDGLDDLVAEEEHEELVFKSDHEFSPESDLDDEVETIQPTKHARTARAGIVPKKRGRSKKVRIEEEVEEEEEAAATEEEEEEEEEAVAAAAKCYKCEQSDHPEWILLCDRCDGGWHANCVKPPLLVIPEGHWFCPPCDHAALLERLQERLETYEFLLQEKEAELKRKKEQEFEAKLANEEAEKQALLEAEEEAQEDDEEEEKNSEAGDLGADGEDEETSEDSGEDEDEEDDDEAESHESDENLNGRRQRKAAKQANYSFKDFDDMIKSALRDEADEEEEESGGKGKGKGPRSGVEANNEDDEDKPRSPPGSRPSGIGNKRISTSDDDSDIMPKVLIRKKKARKLNDLSATSNEDDSDEDFEGSSAEGSDSEDDEEDASDSRDSFVVDDDSDDDIVHVRSKKKARVASPIIRRSARSSRKRNLRFDSSDTSEDESEYEEKPTKRKKGNESWDSSGASSSDASWGRSKKRSATKSRAKPIAAPKPKPQPSPRKPPSNRGRGRGGRANKVESDDEPFRSNVSVKKIKQAQPEKAEEEEDSDHAQKRTTRGRQISYKELISSGESQDEDCITAKKMGTLFAADRIRNMPGAAIRGGSSRRGSRGGVVTQTSGRANISGGDKTPVPVSVISSRIGTVLNQDDESRFSGSTDTIEFSSAVASATAAASAYTTGDESHTSSDILTPNVDPDLSTLPLVLPHEDEACPVTKDEIPASIPVPVPAQDLQVSRLIQQRPVEVPPTLPPDLQINRLINSHAISSSSSLARQSPGILPQQRLLRDVLDSQTPPPPVQLSPVILTQPPIIAPIVELPSYSHSGVIKQTRHSLPPTPPLYSSPHVVKTSDLLSSVTLPSVIRPYPTTASASPLSPSVSGSSTPGNPLSIQGLLGTGHGSPGSTPSAPPPSHPSGHIRPYGNTPHMIGHGPFLNHTPYANPYSAGPPTRTSYMGTPVTPTPRQAYPPMYSSPHLPPHGLPLHSPYQHHGPPLRPTSSYQHAGFPQAFAAAAAAAASAEEERRIYRVAAQASREAGADSYEPGTSSGPLLKGNAEDPTPPTAVPPESEFGGLVSYFSSQQEDFEES